MIKMRLDQEIRRLECRPIIETRSHIYDVLLDCIYRYMRRYLPILKDINIVFLDAGCAKTELALLYDLSNKHKVGFNKVFFVDQLMYRNDRVVDDPAHLQTLLRLHPTRELALYFYQATRQNMKKNIKEYKDLQTILTYFKKKKIIETAQCLDINANVLNQRFEEEDINLIIAIHPHTNYLVDDNYKRFRGSLASHFLMYLYKYPDVLVETIYRGDTIEQMTNQYGPIQDKWKKIYQQFLLPLTPREKEQLIAFQGDDSIVDRQHFLKQRKRHQRTRRFT